MRSLLLFLVCGMLLITGVAHAQSNLVLFISDPGDYIGQGFTYTTTNSADFTFSGTLPFVQASAFGYGFTFTGPGGSNLTVAAYTNATRWPFNGSNPGIDISGNGRGCNMECGSFQVLEIHTNASGQVDHFWGVFSNQCECFFAPMGGEIRYNSLLAPPPPPPNTLRVPANYPTIQAAINAAVSGDTVLVSPGIYLENINFIGKTITVESEAGPGSTIIDGHKSGSVVTLTSGEGRSAILTGFTVRNGYASDGGGINIANSSPSIIGNIITSNQACSGCGIEISFGSPLIQSNKISVNTTSYSICSGGSGGGLYIGGAASAEILDNEILDNVPNDNNGGGIELFAAGTPTIRNNLIKGNALYGIAMANYSDALIVQNVIVSNGIAGIQSLVPSGNRGPFVINNTIVDNDGVQVGIGGFDSNSEIINNIIVAPPGEIAISCGSGYGNLPPIIISNNVYSTSGDPFAGICGAQTNLNGNISADPQFVNPSQGDYHLQATSPSIDAGNNNAPGVPGTDFDGNPRIVDGHDSGVAIIDQGAYEFASAVITIDCPSNIVTATDRGACSATVNYPLPVATAGATVVCQPPSGSIFALGSTPVVCTASNAGFAAVSCTFTVTVNDATAPTITGPSDVTVPCALQIPPPDFADGSVTDNCRGVTVVWAGDATNDLSCPDRFTIQRTYIATDASGNATNCVQQITVNSSTAPTITCPSKVTASADTNTCSASGVALGSVTALSICGDSATVSNNAPSQFPRGTNTVIWTATDRCGNSATCTQLVIVVDDQPPTITQCAPSMTASANTNGQASVPVFTNAVVAADNCTSTSALAITQNPMVGALVGLGTNTVTITVKDEAGNASQCATSFIVTQSVAQAGCQTTQDLINRITGLRLDQTSKDELLDIVQDTHPGFGTKGRGNDRQLDKFTQEVIQFKWTGLLDQATADDLINCAQSILPEGHGHDN